MPEAELAQLDLAPTAMEADPKMVGRRARSLDVIEHPFPPPGSQTRRSAGMEFMTLPTDLGFNTPPWWVPVGAVVG